jgi:phosphatidate cytidylyltransferase
VSTEHKQRWAAAVAGVVLLFGIYFLFRQAGLVFLTVLLSFAAYREFLEFSGAARGWKWLAWAVGLALSAWLCLALPGELPALYTSAALLLLAGLWQAHRAPAEALAAGLQQAQSRVFALVYLIVFPSFVPRIHRLPHGPTLLLFLLLIIWLGDTAAYYGGKCLGRHKLSPNVSPGKTWEGALTALLACALLGFFYGRYALPYLWVWKPVVLAVFCSAIAQAGDLLESLMKRAYGVKDSGSLIPGHGGVFDRFDSLIFAAPFFYLLLALLA